MDEWGDLRWVATLIAAVIAALVAIFGVHWRDAATERRRRRSKILDIQVALRAEIRAHVRQMEQNDLEDYYEAMSARLGRDPSSTPIPPREEHDRVYRALLSEVHLLPTEAVEPVVIYYAQLASLTLFAEQMSGEGFRALADERRATAYLDLLLMKVQALENAQEAEAALTRSILNSPGAARGDPGSARISTGQP